MVIHAGSGVHVSNSRTRELRQEDLKVHGSLGYGTRKEYKVKYKNERRIATLYTHLG